MEELASYTIAEASINQYHPGLGNGEGGGMACAFHSLSFIDHIQRQDFCLKLRSNSVLAPVATELIREDLPCLTDDTATTMATEILLAGTGLAKQVTASQLSDFGGASMPEIFAALRGGAQCRLVRHTSVCCVKLSFQATARQLQWHHW